MSNKSIPPPDLDTPEGLPEVQAAASADLMSRARKCDQCGQEGRVVCNDLGRNVHCGRCDRWWPVSMGPQISANITLPRDITDKRVISPQQDPNLAQQNLEEWNE